MRRPRATIAGWMGLTAFAALNAALARAFVVDREFFEGILLIAIAFQVGLVGLIRGRGRARRFWIGFEVAGAAAILALIAAEEFPDSTWNGWVSAYTSTAVNLAFSHLPTPLAGHLEEDQGQLLAIIYFVPLLLAALAGGFLAALVARPIQVPGGSELPGASPSTPAQSRS